MKFIELFAGIGGFRYGLENAGGYECVWANEIDKHAAAVYRKHWNDGTMQEGDIRTIDASGLPDHELLCAGFPCQSFSIAGKRKGFGDTRGTLFFEICRVLRAKRPSYILLENVKGLLNHENGNTFETILGELAELGYDCQWQLFDSKRHGVPQNRERVFIIGHLRGKSRPQVFPFRQDSATADHVQRQSVNTLTARYWGGQSTGSYIVESEQHKEINLNQIGNVDTKGHNSICRRVYSPIGLAATLNANGGGLGGKTGLYAIPVITPHRLKKRQNGRRFGDNQGPAFTLTAQDRHGVFDGKDIRVLTPLECERLQGFPDNWTAQGLYSDGTIKQVSDNQRYKMTGNAVTTNVVADIAKKFKNDYKKGN